MRFLFPATVLLGALGVPGNSAHALPLSLPATSTPFTLTASLHELQATPGQTEKLQAWVRQGGALRVSTDAATLFGLGVVQPRERSFAQPGQRFVRAHEALPFGATPLLWTLSLQGSVGQNDAFPGVREVFAHLLSPNDVLLSSVGTAGVPLLRVEDTDDDAPLYASALVHYGRGWVVFAPQTIEERAQGAAFEENVEEFLTACSQKSWTFLPASALSSNRSWDERLAALTDASDTEAGPDDAATPPGPVRGLPLSRGEVAAIRAVWEKAARPHATDEAQASAQALLTLLQMRESDLHPATASVHSGEENASAATRTSAWRDEFDKHENKGAYWRFALWWNGVFALRTCKVTRAKTEKMDVRPMEPLLAAADETLSWWDFSGDAALTLPDGTESDKDALDAHYAAQDVDDCLVAISASTGGGTSIGDLIAWSPHAVTTMLQKSESPSIPNRMPLLVNWTSTGGAPCSMEIPATLADLPDFAPNVYFYGLPIVHDNPDNLAEIDFSWFKQLSGPLGGGIDWTMGTTDYVPNKLAAETSKGQVAIAISYLQLEGIAVLPLGAVAHPLMNVPSVAIRPQLVWRCSPLWSATCPTRYGFSPLALDVLATKNRHQVFPHFEPPQNQAPSATKTETVSTGASKGSATTTTQVFAETTEFNAASWNFDVRPNNTLEAHIEGEQIILPCPGEEPHPSLDTMRYLHLADSWRDPILAPHRQYIALEWGLDEDEATFTPARMARLSATLCLQHWLDDTPQDLPAWMERGLQNLFSLDTANFITANQATPAKVLMPPPADFVPEIAQTTSRPREFAAMEAAARRTSLLCSDAYAPVDARDPKQPVINMALEDEDATKAMRFFYAHFGAGAVIETIQRIGAGQNADEAILATTGLTQKELLAQAKAAPRA